MLCLLSLILTDKQLIVLLILFSFLSMPLTSGFIFFVLFLLLAFDYFALLFFKSLRSFGVINFSFNWFSRIPQIFFSLHMFGIFLLYFCYSFLAWFHCGQGTHSVYKFLCFLRFVLWARIWSILVHVPWVLERNMYSVVVGGRLCKCWDPVGWWCCWVLLYPLYIADFI